MIEEVTLRGFKSYASQQTIRFTRGVNKISGRNAAGKTTILEAVLFALYGEVPGVDKKDLVSIGGSTLEVTVRFRSPVTGQQVTVTRGGELSSTKTRGDGFRGTDSYLRVEGEAPITKAQDIQPRLRELLGVGRVTFLNVVYARQKEFVRLLDPEKGRMNAILGLTAPSEIREELKETRRLLETRGSLADKGKLEERIRLAEETRCDAGAQLDAAKTRREAVTKELAAKRLEQRQAQLRVEEAEKASDAIRALEKQRSDLTVTERLREENEEKLRDLATELGEQPEKKQEELVTRRRNAEATEERIRALIDGDHRARQRALDAEAATLLHQITEHGDLQRQGLAVCPKCGQPVDREALTRDLEEWTRRLEEKRRQLKTLDNEIRDLQAQSAEARRKRDDAVRALTDHQAQTRRLDDLKRSATQLAEKARTQAAKLAEAEEKTLAGARALLGAAASTEQAARRLEERLRALRREAADAQGEVKGREAVVAETERAIRDTEARVKAAEQTLTEGRAQLDRIDEYEAKIRSLDLIVDQYAEYEKALREHTLRRLEDWTFDYFRRLTDQHLYEKILIDRETYALEVKPGDNPRMIPAWRAGGGHESILALAERLALLRVMNFPHLLILDEPTDAVDSENIPQLLEYVSKSTREIGQILLVTHHGQGEEEGVNIISVHKTLERRESRATQERV